MTNCSETFESVWSDGVRILGTVLCKRDFRYHAINSGIGSGGRFIAGEYLSGWKSLEFHYRCSLGLVTYRVRDFSISHAEYMHFLGVQRECRYPGFSDDPLQGFRDLAHDLETYCSDFIDGNAEQIVKYARELQQNPSKFQEPPE